MAKCALIHLEESISDPAAMMDRLKLELTALRRLGVPAVKIIHATEGKACMEAKREVRLQLTRMKNHGEIRALCHGEKFGPFEVDGRHIASLFSDFRKDQDWSRRNSGVTLVVLKK